MSVCSVLQAGSGDPRLAIVSPWFWALGLEQCRDPDTVLARSTQGTEKQKAEKQQRGPLVPTSALSQA